MPAAGGQPHNHGPAAGRATAVVTDSACALPHDLARAAGLHVAAMQITIGDRTYMDGPDGMTPAQFAALRDRRVAPQTSAPTPAAWAEQIRAAAGQAASVLCVTLAARLSAAYDAARSAAELVAADLPGTEIRVLDSDAAAGSEALVALEAARTAAAGRSIDDVESAARNVVQRVRLLAYLDTLEYVWRSGRVPRIAFWATSLFDVKPVMEWYRGRVGVVARPRSRRKAADRVFDEMTREIAGRPAHIVVMHSDAFDDASALRDRIVAAFSPVEMITTQFATFMAAHTGPGLVGAAYWCE